MVMSPTGLGNKNYSAGEDQQQFTRPNDPNESSSRRREPPFQNM
jgi:hypothetical protein